MKKILCAIVISVMFMSVPVLAKDAVKGGSKADTATAKEIENLKKLVIDKEKEINNSHWEIKLVSADPKVKSEDDALVFGANQVSIGSMKNKGYNPTNYTVSVAPGQEKGKETATFETMQSGPDAARAFIKGNWKESQMQGTLNVRTGEGEKQKVAEYTFTSFKRKEVKPEDDKKEAVEDAPIVEKKDEKKKSPGVLVS